MKAVRVLSPSGAGFAVFEVVVDTGKGLVSLLRTADGIRATGGRYDSLDEAFRRNTRTITTAERVDVADLDAARALLA